MNAKRPLLLLVYLAALPLASCTGSKSNCTTNCPTGDATVNITLYDTPPTGVNVLSFSLPIVGISLTPSTGSPISIYSPTTITPTELTRLVTESAVVTTGVQVVAGTYTSVNVTLATSSGVFINASTTPITVPGTSSSSSTTCNAGMVCTLPNGATATVNIPLSLTLSSGQNTWIGIDVNLNNAITTTTTSTTTNIGVDFTQPNTFTATTTPRTGTPSGAFDTIGDFIGTVTALSSTSITVQNTITGQSLTAALNSGTEFDAAPGTYSACTSATSCLVKGSVVSMDSVLTNSGTFTATEVDVLDTVATDEIEGVIYPTGTAGVVGLILADKISASGNTTLGASSTTFGTGIFLTAGTNINYLIDSKNLTSATGFNPVGFAGSGDLLAGQQIRAQVTGVGTATINGATSIVATATNVLLRWSRFSATIFGVQGSIFTISGFPTYMGSFGGILSSVSTPLVYSYSPQTLFDGVSGTSDPNFIVGNPLAVRALYLNGTNPTFQAGKVRVP